MLNYTYSSLPAILTGTEMAKLENSHVHSRFTDWQLVMRLRPFESSTSPSRRTSVGCTDQWTLRFLSYIHPYSIYCEWSRASVQDSKWSNKSLLSSDHWSFVPLKQQVPKHLTNTNWHTCFNSCVLSLHGELQRGFSHRLLSEKNLNLISKQHDKVRYISLD